MYNGVGFSRSICCLGDSGDEWTVSMKCWHVALSLLFYSPVTLCFTLSLLSHLHKWLDIHEQFMDLM